MASLFNMDDARQQGLYQGLLGLGAQLMAAGAPSTQPGGMGRAMGQGLLGFQQGQQGYMNNAMRTGLLGMQMDQFGQQQKDAEAWRQKYGPGAATLAALDGIGGNVSSGTADPRMNEFLMAMGPQAGSKFLGDQYAKTQDLQNKVKFDPLIAAATEAAKNPALLERKAGEAQVDMRYKPAMEALMADARLGPAIKEYLAKANIDLQTKPQLEAATTSAREGAALPFVGPKAEAEIAVKEAPGTLAGINKQAKLTELADAGRTKEEVNASLLRTIRTGRDLLDHPGRLAGTGKDYWRSNIPGTEAKGFSAKLESFKAQNFLPAVQQLKGMGALSNAEGGKLEAAIGALDPAMPEREFEMSLNQIVNDLEKAYARAVGGPRQTGASGGWSITRIE